MKTFVSILVVIILFFVSWSFYFRKNRESQTHPNELLSGLTTEEKGSLSAICRGLLYSSSLGYTLFGDKPVSFVSDYRKSYKNDELTFFQQQLVSLIRKHKPPIQTPLFAIVFEESRGGVEDIYLINKKAFLRVVQENLSLFRVFLDKEISPQKLLQSVLEKGFLQSLHGSHALFGILFGFGAQNALDFDRRNLLDPTMIGIPPWKETRGSRFLKTMDKGLLLRERIWTLNFMNADRTPSPSFTTVQEELDALDKKLMCHSFFDNPSYVSASIPLPPFACDPESLETRSLLKKYEAQRALLERLGKEDALFEKVLEKFFSTDR